MDLELQRARRDGDPEKIAKLERRSGKKPELEYKFIFWKDIPSSTREKIEKQIQIHAPYIRWWYEFEVFKAQDEWVSYYKVTWLGASGIRHAFNVFESDRVRELEY